MAEAAAQALVNCRYRSPMVHTAADDIGEAIRAARHWQAEAINIFSSPFLASLYREIISLAAEYRLPAIYQWREHADAGGLISYGPGLAAMFRQTAAIVVKIIKGAKPGDLRSNSRQNSGW